MPTIGSRCHELRINDKNRTWRIIYRIDPDAIILLEVFSKKSRETPQRVIDACKRDFSIDIDEISATYCK